MERCIRGIGRRRHLRRSVGLWRHRWPRWSRGWWRPHRTSRGAAGLVCLRRHGPARLDRPRQGWIAGLRPITVGRHPGSARCGWILRSTGIGGGHVARLPKGVARRRSCADLGHHAGRSRSGVRRHAAQQLRIFGHLEHPLLLLDQLALRRNNDIGGQRVDPVLPGGCWEVISVQLDGNIVGLDGGNHRGLWKHILFHLAAHDAPRRPEVHQYKPIGLSGEAFRAIESGLPVDGGLGVGPRGDTCQYRDDQRKSTSCPHLHCLSRSPG